MEKVEEKWNTNGGVGEDRRAMEGKLLTSDQKSKFTLVFENVSKVTYLQQMMFSYY